ncbi:MAG: MATE family multidrug resistance protein, partial [Planctomycetota bacterium]
CVLGNSWIGGTMLIGIGIVSGMDPIISQAHGAANCQRLGRTLHRSIVISLLVSIPIVMLWYATENALLFLGQDPGISAYAHEYVVAQVPSLPCFLVFTAFRQYLTGRGILIPALVVVLLANGLNVFFDWALVFGEFGFPEMGLIGAGIATNVTRSCMVIMLAVWIFAGGLHQGAWVPWSKASFKWSGLRDILRFGIPISLSLSFEIWAFQIATYFAGWLDTTDLAAHGIVMNVASLSFMIPLGIAIGASTRVGNLIGAGDRIGAQRTAWAAILMGGLSMFMFAIAFVVFRDEIPKLYSTEAKVIAAAAAILPLAALFQVFDGIQVVGSGVLRGMGRTRPAVVFNFIAFYVLALPIGATLTFTVGIGLPGIWWGLFIGLAAVAVMLLAWIKTRGPASASYALIPVEEGA